jgi:ATP synthase protein I
VPAALDGPTSSGPMTADQATRAVLRASVGATAVVGVLAVVIAYLARGGNGALAAVLGASIVVLFFASGQSSNPELVLSAGLLLYLTQIAVLFVLIALLKDATWLDPKVFAITVVMCTLAFTGVAVLTTQRAKVLYVEPVSDPSDEPALTTEADQ